MPRWPKQRRISGSRRVDSEWIEPAKNPARHLEAFRANPLRLCEIHHALIIFHQEIKDKDRELGPLRHVANGLGIGAGLLQHGLNQFGIARDMAKARICQILRFVSGHAIHPLF